MSDVNYDFFIHVLMMIYAERVKKQVDTKDLGLSDEFWAEATGKLDGRDNIKAKNELQWIPMEFSGAEDNMRRREPFKYTENRWDLLEFVEFSREKAEKNPVISGGSQWKESRSQCPPPDPSGSAVLGSGSRHQPMLSSADGPVATSAYITAGPAVSPAKLGHLASNQALDQAMAIIQEVLAARSVGLFSQRHDTAPTYVNHVEGKQGSKAGAIFGGI
ncbi:hypothetical protein B0H14DRAFT_2625966 [Mycena olivaceomarginata]|nr:hypothetical protein B0H14DRAFT_2625966 [Mycena olivaceomarginata]